MSFHAHLTQKILNCLLQVATYYFRNYQMQLNEMIVRNEDTPEYNPEILEELEDVNSKIIETHIR